MHNASRKPVHFREQVTSGIGCSERGQGLGPVAGSAAELDLTGQHAGFGAQQGEPPAYQREGRLAVFAQVTGAAGGGSS